MTPAALILSLDEFLRGSFMRGDAHSSAQASSPLTHLLTVSVTCGGVKPLNQFDVICIHVISLILLGGQYKEQLKIGAR